jgi:hypothetical protein
MRTFLSNSFCKYVLLLPLWLLIAGTVYADVTISGKVTDEKGRPLRGASVSLLNTIDGASTDSIGNFKFTTSEKGLQTIVATEVSHENGGLPVNVDSSVSGISIRLKTNAHLLEQVTISAGSFQASNANKTVLKPLDIVTTAGANADVVKAIETLPGTQQTGTENGLFVRGGDASEAAILVDEMVVQNAFFSSAPGVATRSRFGAFQFQGISFSSGGYSARYGQALSGILELQSTDLPDKTTANLGINMAGVYASGTKRWKNSSLDIGGNYINLSPFYGIATTNVKFYNVPVGGGANVRYVWKPNKDGLLKITANGTTNTSGIQIPNSYAQISNSASAGYNEFSQAGDTVNFRTDAQNYYANATYKQLFHKHYELYTAASFSYDKTANHFATIPLNEDDKRGQVRAEGRDYINSKLSLLIGGEVQQINIEKNISDIIRQKFTETQIAGYAEADWSPYKWLAFRPGVRFEHSALLNESAVAPRLSMAIRTGQYSQVSLAGGIFYQNPDNAYLLDSSVRSHIKFQQAVHYIANWQWIKEDRTLRLEGYYKNYRDLVREHISYDPNSYRTIFNSENVDNSGYGYAQGLELFWRDKKTVKNLDYWISYSYIDTKRLYKNFISEATPEFIADHNLNIVAKYFVNRWSTNFSATYSYASGRPYYNPGNPTFLGDRTPAFNNLALTVSYLHTFGRWFSVFYLSVDNITNQHNVFGYRYTYDANNTVNGKLPILPALYRSIFVGANFSLTQFKKDEL